MLQVISNPEYKPRAGCIKPKVETIGCGQYIVYYAVFMSMEPSEVLRYRVRHMSNGKLIAIDCDTQSVKAVAYDMFSLLAELDSVHDREEYADIN